MVNINVDLNFYLLINFNSYFNKILDPVIKI